MKLTATILPMVMALQASGVHAAHVVVTWGQCKSSYEEQTQTNDEVCTNVSGMKSETLCRLRVDYKYCDFYTTACFVPWGETRRLSSDQGTVDVHGWPSIKAYACYGDS